MTAVFAFSHGSVPLLISVPHDGRYIPPDLATSMTATGKAIPDTDWDVIRLYAFAGELGASVLTANYSRYVVDLNRSASDEVLYPGQFSTSVCPMASFSGEALYLADKIPDDREKHRRIHAYWRPYHEKLAATLAEIKARFGYALLWDAHSIPSEVPLLFPGRLPDLNIGSNGGRSCDATMEVSVAGVAKASSYSAVVNGRFKGGYITRQYGKPDHDVHAIQLELVQSCYMDEKSLRYDEARAAQLGETIRQMLRAFMTSAEKMYA
jgi:N-formylglutamate amidohydrolase